MPTLNADPLPFVSPPDSDRIKSMPFNDSFSLMDSNVIHDSNDTTTSGNNNNVALVTLASAEMDHPQSQFNPSAKRKRWKKVAKKKPRVFGNDILTNSRKYLTVPPPSPATGRDFYIKPNYYDNGDNDCMNSAFDESNEKLFERQTLKRSTRRKDLSSFSSSSSTSSSSPEALASSYDAKESSSSSLSPSSAGASVNSSNSSTSTKQNKTTTGKGSTYKNQIDAQFSKHIAALCDYKNKHGHFDIPSTYPPNQPLSNWVGNINYSYNLIKRGYNGTIRLSKERLDMLNEIGYVFKDMNVRTKSDSASKVKSKRKNGANPLNDVVNSNKDLSVKRKKRK